MIDATLSHLQRVRAVARDEHWTGRKWKPRETALFAAVVSGGVWALIVGMATIML
jgi:hypothetical protein